MPDPLHPHSPFVAAPCSFGRGESLSVLRGAFFYFRHGPSPPRSAGYTTLLLILAEGRGSKLARDLPGTGSKTLYLDKVVSVKACFIFIE